MFLPCARTFVIERTRKSKRQIVLALQCQAESLQPSLMSLVSPVLKNGEVDLSNTELSVAELEALADAPLPSGGPGRAMNGNFVLHEVTFSGAPKADPGKATKVGLGSATADFSQQSWDVAGAVDGNLATGWAVSPSFNKNHVAIFETQADAGATGGSVLTFDLSQQFNDSAHSLGKFRISVTNSPRPLRMAELPAPLAKVLTIPAAERTDEHRKLLMDEYRKTDRTLTDLEAQVKRSEEMVKNKRLLGVQDLAWALINNPSFLFNR